MTRFVIIHDYSAEQPIYQCRAVSSKEGQVIYSRIRASDGLILAIGANVPYLVAEHVICKLGLEAKGLGTS